MALPFNGLILRAAIGAALNSVAAANPKAGDALKTLGPTIDSAVAQIANRATDKVLADPVITNQLNGESPVQSRVVLGSSLASFGGVAILALQTFLPDYDWATWIATIPVILGGLYALYGRLATGLRPLFETWFKKQPPAQPKLPGL